MQCFDTKRISAYVLMQEVCQIWNTKKKPWKHCVSKASWRSGRDSNPRAIARKLISSQPRYDHFDTAAFFLRCYQPNYYAITFGVLQGIFSYLRHILLP